MEQVKMKANEKTFTCIKNDQYYYYSFIYYFFSFFHVYFFFKRFYTWNLYTYISVVFPAHPQLTPKPPFDKIVTKSYTPPSTPLGIRFRCGVGGEHTNTPTQGCTDVVKEQTSSKCSFNK